LTNKEIIPTDYLPFIKAAIADGWSIEPTYESENVMRAGTLKKAAGEGNEWHLTYINRPEMTCYNDPEFKKLFGGRIHMWGPDGLAIPIDEKDTENGGYDWTALQAALRTCGYCHATNVETTRISFAGRCCLACRNDKELTRKVEYPGWTR